eukprot:6973790-Lingulodinium_polyedra.AAC.1
MHARARAAFARQIVARALCVHPRCTAPRRRIAHLTASLRSSFSKGALQRHAVQCARAMRAPF